MKVFLVWLSACLVGLLVPSWRGDDWGQLPSATARPQETGQLSGVILTDEESPGPVRHATVALAEDDSGFVRVATSDEAGSFLFSHLPSGRFLLTAKRNGFVPLWYGGKHPGSGPSVPIVLAEGERVEVALRMLRGAVITGTVTDPIGRPIPDVEVRILSAKADDSPDIAQFPNATSMTDDRGVYRLFGLPPAEYQVVAQASLISARLGDPFLVSPAGWNWLAQLQTSSRPVLPPPTHSVRYAPVYYPGTVDRSLAVPVVLGTAQEVTVDFRLQLVSTVAIAGQVVRPNDQTARASLALVLVRVVNGHLSKEPNDSSATVGGPLTCAPVGGDGSFRCSGLVFGSYRLIIRTPQSFVGPGLSTPPLTADAPVPLWGELPVNVFEDDQTGLTVQLQPGVTVEGAIRLRNPPPQVRFPILRLSLKPDWPTTVPTPLSPSPARLRPDGSFRFVGVPPGSYRMEIANLSLSPAQGVQAEPSGSAPTWVASSALLNGKDLLDVPVEVQGQDVRNVIVTLVQHQASLSGTVLDEQGRRASTVAIIAFATDPSLWREGSRRIRLVQPGTDGSYKVPGLPAGSYYVAALREYEKERLTDEAFLRTIEPYSLKVSLEEGEDRVLDVKLGSRR